MADDRQILGDKVRTLEDEFFRKEDQRLTTHLKQLRELEMSREALAKSSGIKNPAIVEKLLSLGIRPEILTALALVPLVEVAWADGSLDDKEREAILNRAEQVGIAPGSPNHALLSSWLERRPPSELISAWTHMIQGLTEQLSAGEVDSLRSSLVERTRAVASASGGFLGIGKVSSGEDETIRRLESAFRKP